MPASSIAQILFRIFALKWVMSGVFRTFPNIYLSWGNGFDFLHLVPSLAYLLMGVLVWWISPWLARMAARGNDREFNLHGVTLEHLYATALMALGVYFTLSHIASTLEWIHYFTINRNNPEAEDATNQYEFYIDLATTVMGITLVCAARNLAAKLCVERPAVEQED